MLEQLKNRADAIPDYDAATSELKALDVTALSIPVIKLKESATNTSIEEFNLVERLSRGAEDRAQMVALFVSTRRCQPRVLSDAVTLLSSGHSTPSCLSPSRRLVKFDKSCDTKDLEEQEAATVDGGLLFLKNCFPAVNNDDLGEILSRCEGDTEWAVNILLDSGYEYNVEGSEVDQNSNVVNEEFEDDVDVPQELELGEPSSDESRAMKSEPICIPSTSSMTPLNLPSPLLELCHQIVSPTEPSPSKLQETVAENSMLRLKTIDEFRKSHNSKKESIARAKTVVSKAPVLGFSVGFDVPYEVEEKPHITTKKSMFKDQVLPQNDVGEAEASGQTNALQNLAYCYGEDVNEEAEHAVPNHQQESPRPSRSLSMLSDSPLAVDSSLTLTLSKELASQLINMFGPVGFHISPESLDEGDLRVCLSRNVARNLHRCWAQTMHEKFDMEENAIQQMMQEDERLARRLQHEENAATTSLGGRDVLHVTPAGVAPPTGGPQDEDLTLREIMDEEMALELSRKEFHQSQKKKVLNWGDDMSTNLKRQKLRQLFPNIDPVMLNEVFKANGFSLEDSVGAIELSHGKPNPAPEDDTLTPTEIQQIQRAKVSSMSEQWLGEDETDSYQSYSDPAYQDFRAEASMHYRLRHECFQKAQEAYRRNMKQAAAFYSQQGHLHTMKLRQANMRAAEKILAYQNQVTSDPSSLDLHGLHVNEAIYVLQAKIGALEAECRGQKVHLSVVTGRGAHSKDGKAKIRPAVLSWLKKNAYRYTEPQEGLFRITLKYRE
jgi:DNA-nicking Smr family endonuclease